MIGRKPLMLLATVFSACSCGASPVLTIADVIDRHEALNGQAVRVRGWVLGCHPLSCRLSENPDGSGKSLGIGSNPHFDSALVRKGGAGLVTNSNGDLIGNPNAHALFIEIEGKVDRTCFSHKREPGAQEVPCLDRAEELQAPRLLEVIKSGPLPTQGLN